MTWSRSRARRLLVSARARLLRAAAELLASADSPTGLAAIARSIGCDGDPAPLDRRRGARSDSTTRSRRGRRHRPRSACARSCSRCATTLRSARCFPATPAACHASPARVVGDRRNSTHAQRSRHRGVVGRSAAAARRRPRRRPAPARRQRCGNAPRAVGRRRRTGRAHAHALGRDPRPRRAHDSLLSRARARGLGARELVARGDAVAAARGGAARHVATAVPLFSRGKRLARRRSRRSSSATSIDACARGGRFHDRVLRPLFFGTLNTPFRRRARTARAFGRVPFLNGGLFARTPVERALARPRLLRRRVRRAALRSSSANTASPRARRRPPGLKRPSIPRCSAERSSRSWLPRSAGAPARSSLPSRSWNASRRRRSRRRC